MKHAVFFIITAILMSRNAHSQSPVLQKAGDPKKDLATILQPGKYNADIYDKPSLTPRQKEIYAKVEKASSTMVDSMAMDTTNYTPGAFNEQVYMKKMGITEEDMEVYNEVRASRRQLVVTKQAAFTIIKNGNRIRFTGPGDNKLLDSLELDLSQANPVVRYKNYPLIYESMSEETDNNNPFKSPLWGHTFSYAQPARLNDPNPLAGHQMPTVMIEFFTGQVKNTGQIFVIFSVVKRGTGPMLSGDGVIVAFK